MKTTSITIRLSNGEPKEGLEALKAFCSAIAPDNKIDKEQIFRDVLGDKEFIEFIAETLPAFTAYDLQNCWDHKCMKARSKGTKARVTV